MQMHFNGSSSSLLILGEQMFGLKNILKFSERNAANSFEIASHLAQDIFAIARKVQNSIKKIKFYVKSAYFPLTTFFRRQTIQAIDMSPQK